MGNESANMENMYEGKNIGIILDKKNLNNFVMKFKWSFNQIKW